MGCISSKVMTRSTSFQEELNQSYQRTTNGILTLEELFVSGSGGNQFLALVCTANTVANKLRTGSFNSESKTGPKTAIEHTSTEPINTWELMAGLEEQAQPVAGSINVDIAERSKSCHWSPVHDASSLALGSFDGIKENEFNWSNKGTVRSRSFHTVEEYDAMLERIWLSRVLQTGFDDDDDDGSVTTVQLHPSKYSLEKSHRAEDDDSDIQEMNQSCSRYKNSVEENAIAEETDVPLNSGPETKAVIPNPSGSSSIEELNVVKNVAEEGNISGKALKRRAIAKELKSLRIPSTIEFLAVASLNEWLHEGGQVYSPGAYVTPKFGSYALTIPGTGYECSESSIFNPELVAAFEENMQQLKAEEEGILKQIAENLEKEADEEISYDIQPKMQILPVIEGGASRMRN